MKRKLNNDWWQHINKHDFWYFIGLITTDGNLSKDSRHIDLTSANLKHLQTIKKIFKIKNMIGKKYNSSKMISYRIQFSSIVFYKYLLKIGLKSNKSKSLNRIKVPKKYFNDFLRGVIDGDGNIQHWKHPQNGHNQCSLRIVSASKIFIKWLQLSIKNINRCAGKIYEENNRYILKYGKIAACRIFRFCYKNNGQIALQRKADLANKCLCLKMGWKRSKTVF